MDNNLEKFNASDKIQEHDFSKNNKSATVYKKK